MTSLPQDWTCAILDNRGVPVGVGVLVKPRNIVTCTHVVAEALKLTALPPEAPTDIVFVRTFRRSERKGARVIGWRLPDETFGDRFQDLCLLEIPEGGDGLAGATWNDLRKQEPRRRNIIRVLGYPVPPGKMSIGSVLLDEVAGGWWQVEPPAKLESGFVPITRGFSGSLAWDTEEDKAIGIVAVKAGETTYVIPSEIIHEAFEGVLANSNSLPQPSSRSVVAAGEHAASAVVDATSPPTSTPEAFQPHGADQAGIPHDVFLCHASPDKPVVRALAEALEARGLRAWLDERELTPGRPWQEALERAIRTVKSAAVLVGPSGIGPWADREMRAFLDEFVRRAIPVIPVLLPGVRAQPDLPPFLAAFTWVDLRAGLKADGLERLRWGITGKRRVPSETTSVVREAASAPPLFKLWNVPLLPDTYRPRPELEDLKRALVSPDGRPLALTGARSRLAVQGMGGIGKSVLAAALARDPEIRRAFPDGVYWLSIGQTPGSPSETLARLFEAVSSNAEPVTFKSAEEGMLALREAFASRALLLVLDDVWDAAHTRPFNVLGERGKMLLTTRSEDVTREVGAEARVLDTLAESDALALLAGCTGVDREDLPPEAGDLARACGELPLALAMVGSRLRGKPRSRWRSALESLRGADLERLRVRLPGYPHTTLLAAMQTSFEDLPPALRPRYLELAVFPEDTPIPEATLATYWRADGLDDAQAQDAIDVFVSRSLARRDGQDRIALHDLQRDFVCARAGEGGLDLDAKLVAGYRAVAPGGLHEGPDDGYFLRNIARHLVAAEGRGTLRALLFDPRWLAVKQKATGSTGLLSDFEVLGGMEGDLPARMVRDALSLSAYVIDRRPAELGGQLVGRLIAVADSVPEVRDLTLTIARTTPRPGIVPLWPSLDSPGGALIRQLEGHENWVNAVAISADGKTAVSGSDDNTLKVWDLSSGQLLRTLEGHENRVKAVAVSADGETAVSGSDDNTLKVWDLSSGQLLRTLEGHENRVNAVAVSADGKTAVSGSDDNTLKVWDLSSGQLLRTLEGHNGSVNAVAVSADGKTAVSGSYDNTLKVWDLSSGQLLRTLEGRPGLVDAVAVSADGKTAVSGSDDNTLKVWDLSSGRLLRTLEGHRNWVKAVAVSADGKTVVSGSDDNTLKVWDLSTGQLLRTLEGRHGLVKAVAVSADGKTAVSGSYDNILKVWDLSSGQLVRTVEGHNGSVNAVAVSADGKTAVSGSDDNTLKVWDLSPGQLLRTLEGHRGSVKAVAVSADGKTAVSGSYDNTLKVWALSSGQLLRTLEGHENWVKAVAVSADGKTAVSGSYDNTLKVWDVSSGQLLRTLEGRQGSVNAVAVSADGKTAVSGSYDNTLKVWDVSSGQLLRTLEGHHGSVNAVAVSTDGKTALSGSADNTLKVWDVSSGQLLRTLEGHQARVRAVAVSADGKTAVSSSDDNTLKVWDLSSGQFLATFTTDGTVLDVALAADGMRFAAGDQRGRIHLYKIIFETTREPPSAPAPILPDPRVALQGVLDGLAAVEGAAFRAKLFLIAAEAERGQVAAIGEYHAGRIRTVDAIWNSFLPRAEELRRDIVRAAFATNVRDDVALTRFVRDHFHHLMGAFAMSTSHLARHRNPGLQMHTIANLVARASQIAAQAPNIVTSMRWDFQAGSAPSAGRESDKRALVGEGSPRTSVVAHDFLEKEGVLRGFRRQGYRVAMPLRSKVAALRREGWQTAVLEHEGVPTSFEVTSGDPNDPHVLVVRRHPELTHEQAVRVARMIGSNVVFTGTDGDYQVARIEPNGAIGAGPPATTRYSVLGRGPTRNDALIAAGVDLPDEP